jgi:hypothetical protein
VCCQCVLQVDGARGWYAGDRVDGCDVRSGDVWGNNVRCVIKEGRKKEGEKKRVEKKEEKYTMENNNKEKKRYCGPKAKLYKNLKIQYMEGATKGGVGSAGGVWRVCKATSNSLKEVTRGPKQSVRAVFY